MRHTKFANIDFEILCSAEDMTPIGIACPFCDYREKIPNLTFPFEGTPNLAREAIEAHWLSCSEFPDDRNA